MFGKKKRELAARLANAFANARAVADSGDVAVLRRARDKLHEAVRDADASSESEELELVMVLGRRITELREATIADRLRPCAHCGSRDFRLSEEFAIDQLDLPTRYETSPKLRLLLCLSCGALAMFLARHEDIESFDLQRLFPTKLRAREEPRGPFR